MEGPTSLNFTRRCTYQTSQEQTFMTDRLGSGAVAGKSVLVAYEAGLTARTIIVGIATPGRPHRSDLCHIIGA